VGLATDNLYRLSALWRRIVSIVLALDAHDAAQKASAMAFAMFLGLVPLAAIVGWAVALFAGDKVQGSIVAALIMVAPRPAAHLIDEHLRRLVEQGTAIAPLSAIGFIWVASGGLHTALASIQMARIGRSRSWWVNRGYAMVVVLIFMVICAGSTTGLVMMESALRAALRAGHMEIGWARVARFIGVAISTLVAMVGGAFFYRLSMYGMTSEGHKVVWPGAFWAAFLWILVSYGFSAYARVLGKYSIFYGSLAAVALLLLWLWISCLILLVGSEINLQIEGMRETMLPPEIPFFNKLKERMERRARK
jgi:membrane protein